MCSNLARFKGYTAAINYLAASPQMLQQQRQARKTNDTLSSINPFGKSSSTAKKKD
jgi:hypothetical protein